MSVFGGLSKKNKIELDRNFEEAVREGGRKFLERLFKSAESEVEEKVIERIQSNNHESIENAIQTLQKEINSETSFGFTVPEVALLWFNVESRITESEFATAREIHNSRSSLSKSEIEKCKRASIYTQELANESLKIMEGYDLEVRDWSQRPEHLALAIHDFEDEGALAKHENEEGAVKNIERKVDKFVENKKEKLLDLRDKAENIEEHAEHAERESGVSDTVEAGDHNEKRASRVSAKEYKRNNLDLDHY